VFTFVALPLVALIYAISDCDFYLSIPQSLIVLTAGVLFGLGMFLFAKSVTYIGLGIPFALNVSLGTLSGSLFSIIIHGKFHQLVNHTTIMSYAIFILAIVFYAYSLSIRDKHSNKHWKKGLTLSLLSGVLCATQGACIGYFSDEVKMFSSQFSALLIPWSLIFLSCSIIFIGSQFIDAKANKQPMNALSSNVYTIKTAVIMSFLYTLSIILYNWANTITMKFSEEFLWVSFMSFIVIASTICSYAKGEWSNCILKGKLINYLSICLLIFSIGLFGAIAL